MSTKRNDRKSQRPKAPSTRPPARTPAPMPAAAHGSHDSHDSHDADEELTLPQFRAVSSKPPTAALKSERAGALKSPPAAPSLRVKPSSLPAASLRKPSSLPAASAPRPSSLPRDAGKGRILYLDAISGIAGDMLVAALIDLGVPRAVIEAGLAGLGLSDYHIEIANVQRSSIAAKAFRVQLDGAQPPRDYAAIVALLTAAESLPEGARQLALTAFARLAAAEARVHGTPIERVHFHELGAVDSIVDIVAAAIALDHLGARLICSPLPLGRGIGRSAHGPLPLPAPATLLCLEQVPTYDAGIAEELVTPTGACLVASAAVGFSGWPSFVPERSGFGAGSKELQDRPNVLRVVLGTESLPAATLPSDGGRHVVVETNVDDTTGEIAAFALSRAMQAGALDAWSLAIGMKKGRPALQLSALCERSKLEAVTRALLSETSSLGVRYHAVERIERPRQLVHVDTDYGPIAVKVAGGDGLPEQVAPEYEDCRRAAETHATPIRQIYQAALSAYSKRLITS